MLGIDKFSIEIEDLVSFESIIYSNRIGLNTLVDLRVVNEYSLMNPVLKPTRRESLKGALMELILNFSK